MPIEPSPMLRSAGHPGGSDAGRRGHLGAHGVTRVLGRLALMLASAGLLAACEEDPAWKDPGPGATFEAFAATLWRGRTEDFLAAITPEDRARLEATRTELKRLAPQDYEVMLDDLISPTRAESPYSIAKTEVLPPLGPVVEPGQRITLKIVYEHGNEAQAQMVWDGTRWLVDLPDPKPRPASPPNAPPTPPQPTAVDDAPAPTEPAERVEPAEPGPAAPQEPLPPTPSDAQAP